MEERACWLAWSQISGIGPVLLNRLQLHFGTLASAWEASPTDLESVDGIGRQTLQAILTARKTLQPEAFLAKHSQQNPCFWTPADADYPRLLLEIPDPPPVLYYRGEVNLAENQGILPGIAVVGTREPSDYGRRWTRRLSAALAQQGFSLVSGLADGIDTEAHHSCLAAGGRTLAVLGTGVDVVYPWRNQKLYEQILQQGLVLSEYPAGTKPDRAHFPRRNRIIAGLSRATIVMEAPLKSGALITAYLANDYGRDVYILPSSLDNPKGVGCLNLVSKGAQVILGESHLLEMLGTLPQIASVEQRSLPLAPSPQATAILSSLNPELQQVLQTLTELSSELNSAAIPFDLIVQQVGLAAAAVSSALLQLELMGLVSQEPGMRYQCC